MNKVFMFAPKSKQLTAMDTVRILLITLYWLRDSYPGKKWVQREKYANHIHLPYLNVWFKMLVKSRRGGGST